MASSSPPGERSPGDPLVLPQTLAERLHDGPLQDLIALQLEAAAVLRSASAGEPLPLERIAELERLARAAVERCSGVIRDLSTGCASPPEDLFTRLIGLCYEFRAAAGIKCLPSIQPEHTRFPPDLADVLYRAVRELLTNVRKHARATLVKLSSGYRHDGAVALTVEDDGIGLRPPARRKKPFENGCGFGLWSIEQRLAGFDAYLELDGAIGVRATLVVPRRWLTD